jgi:hypothetical protein
MYMAEAIAWGLVHKLMLACVGVGMGASAAAQTDTRCLHAHAHAVMWSPVADTIEL